MTYYDAQADIVHVELLDIEVARSVEHDWGLVDLDNDGKPVGLEYWHASERLPGELLAVLPAPARAVGTSQN